MHFIFKFYKMNLNIHRWAEPGTAATEIVPLSGLLLLMVGVHI